MSKLSPYLVPDTPYPFCPGCSHGQVIDGIAAALDRLLPASKDVVLVSDIGCVGLADKHFAVHTFHGLHGRSITYASGLKLARPEARVFVVIGDGGCGIGGHHLIQAARRGDDLTVLVFDNFNYGMTGGEHSSTTPVGAKTSSTPYGNAERPLDLCALAQAAGATFVARLPAFDPELPAVVARAAEHRGFALIDVWEFCTAHFTPANTFKKKDLLELSEAAHMPFGVLVDRGVPSWSASTPAPEHPGLPIVTEAPKAPAPVYLERAFAAKLERPLGMLVAGSAGQKIKSAGTMLGRASVRAGLFATQKDDYPITVKTGHSVAELILSPKPVRFTGLDTPEVAIVLAREGWLRAKKMLEAMPEDAVIFAAKGLELPKLRARVEELDLDHASRKVGKENVALWALSKTLPSVDAELAASFVDTVGRFTPSRYRDQALAAVQTA
ncbi:thiamine pyrophosphate-dependent enzyme [Myxococcota bacterium]|nr:thiamine pyrophosphate-dependent enzyme [Myxococcota bacterium]